MHVENPSNLFIKLLLQIQFTILLLAGDLISQHNDVSLSPDEERPNINELIRSSRADSKKIRLFAKGGKGKAINVEAWEMDPSAPWQIK